MPRPFNFRPFENKILSWTGASDSKNVEFNSSLPQGTNGSTSLTALEVFNSCSVPVTVSWGTDDSVSADDTSYVVGPGVDKIIDVGAFSWVAVKPLAIATGSVYISRGIGS